jgi:D-threo-aldose 1-dehydrogenase
MRHVTFNCPSGASLETTELGCGGAPLGNLLAAIPEDVAQATLEAAWDAGMRWFDTSPLYGLGLSEERFGHCLRTKPSGDFILSTKVGRLLEDCGPDQANPDKFVVPPNRRFFYDYSYDGVMRSFEISLDRLGLDRIDVLLCHDVDIWTHGTAEASDARVREFMSGGYRAFVELRDQGVIRAIGAGLNEWQVCERMAREGDFDLFLLAGRYTLLEQEALESFLPLCEERGIGILLGGPFNSGILATGAIEGAIYNYQPAPPEVLARVARIEKVCTAHGVPIAAAALQFPLAHPSVISIIPGPRRPEEVAQAIDTLAADIPDTLWSDLRAEGLLDATAPTPGGTS